MTQQTNEYLVFLTGRQFPFRVTGGVVDENRAGEVALETTTVDVPFVRAGLIEPVTYTVEDVYLQYSDAALPKGWWKLEPAASGPSKLALTFKGTEFWTSFAPRLKQIERSSVPLGEDPDYALYDAITSARTVELLVSATSAGSTQKQHATLRVELDYGRSA
jgi:hypothetical protein